MMKVKRICIIGLVCVSLFFSCTPTALETNTDSPTIVSTGDDQSVRPDNEKD